MFNLFSETSGKVVFFVTLHGRSNIESAGASASGGAGNRSSGGGHVSRGGQSSLGAGFNSSGAGRSSEAQGSSEGRFLGRFREIVIIVRVGESGSSVSGRSGSSKSGSSGGGVFTESSVVRVSGEDTFAEFTVGDSGISVNIDSSQDGEDVLFNDGDTVLGEEAVESIEVASAEVAFSDGFISGSQVEVVSGDEVFLEEFDLSGKIDFLVEDLGKTEFNFIRKDFVISNVVAVSLGGDGSEDAVGLGEDDFEEIGVRQSTVSGGGVLLEDVSNILFEDDEVVFSEEVDDLVDREGTSGETSDSLEGSVGFESRSFGKDLSRDFNVLFSVGEGLEDGSELVFSGDAKHGC